MVDGLSPWRGLLLSWAVVLATAALAAALVQSLGPPANIPGRPAADAHPTAQAAGPGAPARPARPGGEIAALLARAQTQTAEGRDDRPPGDNAADTLHRLAAALPGASASDRQRIQATVAALFDRAKAAADAGRVDEEQRFLALGSILAPPPDIAPERTRVAEQAASAQSAPPDVHLPGGAGSAEPDAGAGPAPRQGASPDHHPPQDITPNAAEAEVQPVPGPSAPPDVHLPGGIGSAEPQAERAAPAQDTPQDLRSEQATMPNQPAPAARVPPAAPAGAAAPPGRPSAAGATPAPGSNAAGQEAASGSGSPAPAADTARPAGTGLAIHLLTSSAAAEADAQQLTARLGSDFDRTETHTEGNPAPADVPRTAMVRYYAADHARALLVGKALGGMGYRWRLTRIATEPPASAPRSVEVWIPGANPAAGDAAPNARHAIASGLW